MLFMPGFKIVSLFTLSSMNRNNQMDLQNFTSLLKESGFRAEESKYKEVYNILDVDGEGQMSMEDFLPIIEVMEENKHLFIKPKRIHKVFSL
jgi:Ca2+-binding EF-hand superfamily protein